MNGQGRVVVVTGAAGGLGAATVAALAEAGASVLAVDLDADALERVTSTGVAAVRCDASDPVRMAAVVDEALRRHGRLDAIFNNAAILGPLRPVHEYPEDELDRVLAVNVRSVFLGMKHAIPPMLAAGGGSILSTASIAGHVGWPRLSGYTASKHAVIGLTRAVALETAGSGIRVNALCPGSMDTAMLWEGADQLDLGDRQEARRVLESLIPVGRMADPAEVAPLAAWLLLEAPEYLTGAVIPIDGGQSTG